MKIETSFEETESKRIVKNYTIAINLEKGEMPELELELWKSWLEEEIGNVYEQDWGWNSEEDRQKYDKLTEEEQEEVDDYINELN